MAKEAYAMKNKRVKQMICDSIRDYFGYTEVTFHKGLDKGLIIGEGIDGGYFSHVIQFGNQSLTAHQLKGK